MHFIFEAFFEGFFVDVSCGFVVEGVNFFEELYVFFDVFVSTCIQLELPVLSPPQQNKQWEVLSVGVNFEFQFFVCLVVPVGVQNWDFVVEIVVVVDFVVFL